MPSKAQELHEIAKQKLAKGGDKAVKAALKAIIDRRPLFPDAHDPLRMFVRDYLGVIIDARGGNEWDGQATENPDYFVNLEIVAEWVGDEDEKNIAAWRQERFEKSGR